METYTVRVSGWAYVEQLIDVEAKSEEDAIAQVEDEELYDNDNWKIVELDEISHIECGITKSFKNT